MRKLLAFLLVIVLELPCFVGCGSPKKIAITPENYEEYFDIKFTYDFQEYESALSGTYYTVTVIGTCRPTVTASYNNVVLTGKVQLSCDQNTHLLYTENKLPLDVEFIIDGTGFAEGQVRYQHGRGSYGGYKPEDFYFECTSASGYIELR